MKYVELNKRTKKEQKEYYAGMRVTCGFNTGTRTMKTDKNPSRARQKRLMMKSLSEY